MYCPKCGNLLNDNAQFCDACGLKLTPEAQPVVPETEPAPAREPEAKPAATKNAFRKWIKDQGLFCLIAKLLAIVVMSLYLLSAIVYAISLAVGSIYYSGGYIFSQFFHLLLTGIVYGAILWLLSDAVLYLQKLWQLKKNENKK